MRILSLNCYGVDLSRARFVALAKESLRLDVDIICLQEVILSWQAQILDDAFKAAGYHTFYQRSKLGRLVRGGLYIAVRATLRPQDQRSGTYTKQADGSQLLAISDWFLQKGWLDIGIEVAGTLVRVVNTHLVANYNHKSTSTYQVNHYQLFQLEEFLQASKEPVLVCADLNMVVSHLPDASYSRTMAEAFDWGVGPHTIDNALNPLRQGTLARWSGRGASKPNKRLDYCFWTSFASRREAMLVFQEPVGPNGYLSDHYGIRVELDT